MVVQTALYESRGSGTSAITGGGALAEQILLAFAASVENWNEVFAARSMEGWAACQPEDCKSICVWSGVHCDPFSSADGDHVTDL